MKLLLLSFKYNLYLFFRIKQVLFFTLVFPLFLFIIFVTIWGTNNPLYVKFILSGVLGMTIMNEGLFTIGPTLRDYKVTNFMQYLQRVPHAVIPYFGGLIFSRIVVMLLIATIMYIIGYMFFGMTNSFIFIFRIVLFIVIGMFIFSFVGLILAFANLRHSSNRNLTNFIQVIILFISDAFYPASQINAIVGTIGDILPLNPILKFVRGGVISPILLAWVFIPPTFFYVFFMKIKNDR